MIDMSDLGKGLGIFFGFFIGIFVSILLAVLGHGWSSLYAFPASILLCLFIGVLLDSGG